MKVTFETEDTLEAKMIIKASDMAGFIWELTHNALRPLESKDVDTEPFERIINRLLEEFDINIDEIYQ